MNTIKLILIIGLVYISYQQNSHKQLTTALALSIAMHIS